MRFPTNCDLCGMFIECESKSVDGDSFNVCLCCDRKAKLVAHYVDRDNRQVISQAGLGFTEYFGNMFKYMLEGMEC